MCVSASLCAVMNVTRGSIRLLKSESYRRWISLLFAYINVHYMYTYVGSMHVHSVTRATAAAATTTTSTPENHSTTTHSTTSTRQTPARPLVLLLFAHRIRGSKSVQTPHIKQPFVHADSTHTHKLACAHAVQSV